MTNTGITLHLVRTLTDARDAAAATETFDLTVDSLRSAREVLDMYRDDTDWVTATAEDATGYLGTGRAGFGTVQTRWDA